ncbi:hypothetical protein RJ640_014761 [Escallonia rubra]|uniref:Cation/H+ exchanger transmembrane domain-containing protein n=1 Tax=Escallonia rubra TaxID=112253 RepID=A0AA88RQS8_9ASTE|nr:hypothetical protein RJ640_014761 [Escallonia rubra]
MLLHGNISIPLRSPLRLRAPYPRNITILAHPPIKSEYTVSDESLKSRGFTLRRTIEDLNLDHLNTVFVVVGFPRRDTDKIRLTLENTDTLLWYEYEYEKTKRPVAFARATGDKRLIADMKIHYFIFMIVATVGVAIRDVELKPLRNILWTGAFIVLVLFVFRPIIVKIGKRIPKGQPMKESQFFAILLVVLVSGFCAQTLGQSSGLASFVLGVSVPGGPPLGYVGKFVGADVVPAEGEARDDVAVLLAEGDREEAEDYNAQLSDFGLAKDGPADGKNHVSTRVMGTYGYAAPE